MARNLSEQVVHELDTLWRMIRFVTGRGAEPAESVLLRLLADEIGDPARIFEEDDGLERRLLRTLFELAPPVPEVDMEGLMVSGLTSEALDAGILLEEAGSIPARARAALWLVMIQRRAHAEAARVLGIASDELHDLLRFRDVLLSRVVTRTAGRFRAAEQGRGGDRP